MKFCASLAFTDTEDYVELAQVAEEHGWDTLVLSDHVVHPERIAAASRHALHRIHGAPASARDRTRSAAR